MRSDDRFIRDLGCRSLLRNRVAVVLACVSLVGCDAVFNIDGLPTARRLVFDNAASESDLVDFPVLVVLDASSGTFGSIDDPERDLRFDDPDTDAALAFEIERWEPGGRSFVWVRVPRIDARSKTDYIDMHFGHEVSASAMADTVWHDFALVVHGDHDVRDSSASGFHGAAINTTHAEGMIGDAIALEPGTGPRSVTFAGSEVLLGGWSEVTIEMWLYPDYPTLELCTSTVERRGLLQSREALDNSFRGPIERGHVGCATDMGPTLVGLTLDTTEGYVDAGAYAPSEAWTHVVLAFDGQRLWNYRNGALVWIERQDNASSLVASSGPLVLGAAMNAFTGRIDELRISRAFRSRDWVVAEYLALANRFIRFERVPEGS